MSLGESATPLGRVDHIGSAKHGGEHWLNEKVLSAALLLLGAWFIASLVMLPALDHRTIVQWLRDPAGAIPMALFVIAAFRHALEGMKTIVDDYVDDGGNRFALHTFFYFLAVGGGALALFALARIAFGVQG